MKVFLFDKLIRRGTPGYIVRLLIYWYANQKMCYYKVGGGEYSSLFCVSNGVRQGGILSLYFFNIYVDDLSSSLKLREVNTCRSGCYLNSILVNHIMYADDLVLFAASVNGLSKLLRVCEQFGTSHSVKYNSKKSFIMSFGFRVNYLKGVDLPDFTLFGEKLREVSSVKYLGHVISNNLSDDLDIERQCRQLYAQGNTILRKFHMCSIQVKLTLFRTYCSPMYTAQLWWSYKKSSMSKLLVSYHNIFKLFIGVSKLRALALSVW